MSLSVLIISLPKLIKLVIFKELVKQHLKVQINLKSKI